MRSRPPPPIRVFVDVLALQCQMSSYSIVVENIAKKMQDSGMLGDSFSFTYFARREDVVTDSTDFPFTWIEGAAEKRSISVNKKTVVSYDEVVNFADLATAIQSSQEQGEVCLVVSPDADLREQVKKNHCVALKVSNFGELEFRHRKDGKGGLILIFQDTDDTSILRMLCWARQVCVLNPYLKKFYEWLSRFYAQELIFVKQITSRLDPKEKGLRGASEAKMEVKEKGDTVETKVNKNFDHAIQMETVCEEIKEWCAEYGIVYEPEAIYVKYEASGKPGSKSMPVLKLVTIYRDFIELRNKDANAQLPSAIYLLDDDYYGQLDLGNPEIRDPYEKLTAMGVAVNLVWSRPGGDYKNSDFDAMLSQLQQLQQEQLDGNPAKRRRISSELFGGAAVVASASSSSSAAPAPAPAPSAPAPSAP